MTLSKSKRVLTLSSLNNHNGVMLTDLLSHIFLPLILIYAVKEEQKVYYLILAPLTLLPDLDKFFGMVGLLHSLVTIVPLCLLLVLLEWSVRKPAELKECRYSLAASLYVFSHLFLDVLDGGPVTLLYPFVEGGVGLTFPATLEFGHSLFDIHIKNLLPKLVWDVPEQSYGNTYEIFSGFGVASTILFLLIVILNKFEECTERSR